MITITITITITIASHVSVILIPGVWLIIQVQHLAAFFFLSVFPQILLVVFLAHLQPNMLPIDRICGTILGVFLLFEIVIGYRTVKHIIRIQTTRFRLDFASNHHQEDDNEEIPVSLAPRATLDLHYPDLSKAALHRPFKPRAKNE